MATTSLLTAYEAVLARWPVDVESIDVPSPFGTTRVQACGPANAVPLVLLHGGGATATVWLHNVAEFAVGHRVYALDQIGDVGCSLNDRRPVTSVDDLMSWLDATLGELGVESADVCGHSNGAWIALNYAIRSPWRVRRLVLLDPTRCFAGLNPVYLWHALPLLRPTGQRMRKFLAWETAGADLDPDWLRLVTVGAEEFTARAKTIIARMPASEALRAMTVPTLVLLAERSRAHAIRRVAARAGALLPDVRTSVLSGLTHHSMPLWRPKELNSQVVDFLA